MVSQELTDLAYGLLDATIEYNTKMILIFMLLVYSVVLFSITFFLERYDERYNEDSKNFQLSRVLLKRFFRWIGGAYIFIFLLMFLFAFRGAKLETLLQLIYALYIPFFGAMAIWGIMYFYDMVLKFTKIGPSNRRNGGRKKRNG